MRKWVVLCAVAASLAAMWASSGVAASGPKVFSFLDVSGPSQPIGGFNFNRPPVAGDRFEINDVLYKWAGTKRGARVGHVEGIGTFLSDFGPDFSRYATVLFVAQAYIPGGSIVVEGHARINPRGPSRFTLPVVGGTGTYADARGFVKIRDLGNGNQDKSNAEFHYLP